MSKWVELEPLIAELQKDEVQFDKEAEEARNNPSAYTDGYADAMWSRANGLRDAMIEIYDAPSIDIVRCGECMHNGSYDTDCPFGWRNGEWNLPKPCDFCSYGEREGE